MLKCKKELVQTFVFCFVFLIVFTFVIIIDDGKKNHSNEVIIKPEVDTTSVVDNLPFWDNRTLIDFEGFQYLNFHKVCIDNISLNVLVLVNSAPGNVEKRVAIRETWGGSMKLLFMLGAIHDSKVQNDIDQENEKYQDILQGNFIDAYKNNTYKHVMGLKYTVYHCSTVKYILKTDDDIYVNTDVVIEFLNELGMVSKNKEMILCSIRSDAPVHRNNYKWAVSFNEYAHSKFPTYCLGPVIIYSLGAAYKLYSIAQLINYFWIDDVHVSGTVAEMANVKRTNLPPVFLQGSSLDKFIKSNGTEGPELFLFSIELKEQIIYNLHKAVQTRRKLLY